MQMLIARCWGAAGPHNSIGELAVYVRTRLLLLLYWVVYRAQAMRLPYST